MEIILRQKFGENNKKFNIGDPRDTIMAYEAVISKIASNSAAQFVNNKFVDRTEYLKNQYEELQRKYDEYYAAVDFFKDNPTFVMPANYFVKPNKDSIERLKISLQSYNSALKLQKESTASCGVVLEFIKSFIGGAVLASLHSTFHDNNLPNNVQVEKVLEYFLDHGLGISVQVKESIDNDLRNHIKARDLRQVKIMFDNLKILRSESQSYSSLVKKSKDLVAMNNSVNPTVIIYKTSNHSLSDDEFASIIKSKIEHTSENLLLLCLPRDYSGENSRNSPPNTKKSLGKWRSYAIQDQSLLHNLF